MVPFSLFQNCFAMLEDKIYSFPLYFRSQLRFWSRKSFFGDGGFWMGNKALQTFNLGPVLFSFGRQLLLICKMWILGPEYGQGLSLNSVWATWWDDPAFSRVIFDGLQYRKRLKLHFALGFKSRIRSWIMNVRPFTEIVVLCVSAEGRL